MFETQTEDFSLHEYTEREDFNIFLRGLKDENYVCLNSLRN